MDYYTIISRDNHVLVEKLLDEISLSGIKSLNDWETCYRMGIDGYLVNIVYNIICDNDIFKKSDIDTMFDIALKPIYKKTSRLSDKQFYDIFNSIWGCIFQTNPLEYRFIKTLASYNQPVWRKVVNSNGFMILVSILLLIVSAILGGSTSFILMLFILFFGSIVIEKYGITKSYIAIFIMGCIILFFLSFSNLNNSGLRFNECFILSYILSLLMIPILIVNKERLKEIETEEEKYYREHNKVK